MSVFGLLFVFFISWCTIASTSPSDYSNPSTGLNGSLTSPPVASTTIGKPTTDSSTTGGPPVNPPKPHNSTILKVNVTGQSPTGRYGVVTALRSSGLIVLGGSGPQVTDHHVWFFTLNTSQWTQGKTVFSISGACSVTDDKGDFVYIYGGKQSDGKPSYTLWKYDIEKDEIKDLKVAGSHPTDGTSCALRNNTLYLFGGDCKSNISKFDLSTTEDKKWEEVAIASESNPPPTKGAAGLLYADQFLMWGGACGETPCAGPVWRFDLVTSKWTADAPVSKTNPEMRAFASVDRDTISIAEKFILFGGSLGNGTKLSDMWTYDLVKNKWEKLVPNIAQGSPAPRSMASFIYDAGRTFIFSGLSSHSTVLDDFWELIIGNDCFERTNSCGECIVNVGCGWCENNLKGYECVPGNGTNSYVPGQCFQSTFSTDPSICPPDPFPGWIVAIIIVGIIMVIGIVWYLVMRMNQKKQGGYEQIN